MATANSSNYVNGLLIAANEVKKPLDHEIDLSKISLETYYSALRALLGIENGLMIAKAGMERNTVLKRDSERFIDPVLLEAMKKLETHQTLMKRFCDNHPNPEELLPPAQVIVLKKQFDLDGKSCLKDYFQ
jgi:hypothetical protein